MKVTKECSKYLSEGLTLKEPWFESEEMCMLITANTQLSAGITSLAYVFC
jgi:hypothetical protein